MENSKLLVLLLTLLLQKSDDPMVTNQLYDEYDFIVVGAGATGAVVASRLSEVPGISVLLLEAGDTDWGNSLVKYPSGFAKMLQTSANWYYDVVEQKGRASKYDKGKVLGGSTSINALQYFRGSPHDYDSWEDHGAKGWGWKDVEPFFKKLENSVDDDISKHLGRGGMLNLTLSYKSKLYDKLVEAGKEIGIKEVDYFDEIEGLSRIAITQYKGFRQSSSDAFLRSVYKERKDRLHIVTNAYVEKVLMDSGSSGTIKAKGVSYIKDGKIKTVNARKEVILSAGSVETPHILMLSGIGPKKHLEDMKIEVKADVPGVGSGMDYHIWIENYYKLKNSHYYGKTASSLKDYIFNGTGFFASEGADGVLHHRTKYFGTDISPSTKKRPFPTIEMLFVPSPNPYSFTTQNKAEYHTIVRLFLIHPKSKGTLRLKSTNPLDQPFIDPKFFSNEDDIKILLEGYKQLEKFEMTETMKGTGFALITPDVCNGTKHDKVPRSDEFYKCYMNGFTGLGHVCCTARMGSDENEMAVVDERLRVRGIQGLRIADASVMPHITSSNTQAPCYMIGEKASHMIKEDWNLF